jgi:hypothetical protein
MISSLGLTCDQVKLNFPVGDCSDTSFELNYRFIPKAMRLLALFPLVF